MELQGREGQRPLGPAVGPPLATSQEMERQSYNHKELGSAYNLKELGSEFSLRAPVRKAAAVAPWF